MKGRNLHFFRAHTPNLRSDRPMMAEGSSSLPYRSSQKVFSSGIAIFALHARIPRTNGDGREPTEILSFGQDAQELRDEMSFLLAILDPPTDVVLSVRGQMADLDQP